MFLQLLWASVDFHQLYQPAVQAHPPQSAVCPPDSWLQRFASSFQKDLTHVQAFLKAKILHSVTVSSPLPVLRPVPQTGSLPHPIQNHPGTDPFPEIVLMHPPAPLPSSRHPDGPIASPGDPESGHDED